MISMETVVFRSSSEQPIFPYKSQVAKTPKKDLNQQSFISRPAENFSQLNLQTPRNFHSYPPFSSQQQQLPPLLPLPLPHTKIRNSDSHPRVRGLSCPPTNRKTNYNNNARAQYASLTPRKPKPLPTSPKNLKGLPVLNSSNSGNSGHTIGTANDRGSMKRTKDDEVHDFSGSAVFTISPPPSSLPLPTFSLRPKLSCNVEAAGFDAGATDKLRRLLRLR